MNYEQPPPYSGPAPGAPGYPPQGYPVQNPAYPSCPPGPMGPYPPPGQPGYQGYPVPPQGQYGWQNAPPPGPMYGEAPKNTGAMATKECSACVNGNLFQGGRKLPFQRRVYGYLAADPVYVVEERRRDDTADTCLTACWTALCCCCLWDMLT